VGKDDFLKLLLTQMQHQDPLNPMDHKDFSAQLAQFSSLEQLTNIGSGIQNLHSGMGDGQKLQAIGLIGKKVDVSGNEIEYKQGNPSRIPLQVASQFTPSKVFIFDQEGKPIRELNLPSKSRVTDIEWDGKNTENVAQPSGKYVFRVFGKGPNGSEQEISSQISGKVTSVDMQGKEPMLSIEVGKASHRVSLSKVTQVTQEEGSQGTILKPGEKPAAQPALNPNDILKMMNANAEEAAAADDHPMEEVPWRSDPASQFTESRF